MTFNKQQYDMQWRKRNPDANKKSCKKYQQKNRMIVLKHYSNNKCICKCCGENDPNFLTLDHEEENGAEHRRNIKAKNSQDVFRWLIKNNFPPGFQVLCFNCNCARSLRGNGTCPHQKIIDRMLFKEDVRG